MHANSQMIHRINRSKSICCIICALIFLFMAALNFLTPKCVDDYAYMISLVTIKPISSFSDIFASLQNHAYSINGRLAAHFFVYLFDWMPKPVFNIVNAAVFLCLILLAGKFCKCGTEHSTLLFVFIFCCIWYFEHDFGQVNLWLTGSCNYLWGIVLSLVYLAPFFDRYVSGKKIDSFVSAVFFIIFSFLSGAYNEVTASSTVFISVLFILVIVFRRNEHPEWYYYASVLAACIGFVTMFLSPAQSEKAAEAPGFAARLVAAAEMYFAYWPLILCWIVIFLYFVSRHKPAAETSDALFLSGIFMLGSLAANFVLVFASSYAGRCAAPGLVLLIIALGILLGRLDTGNAGNAAFVIMLLIIPFAAYNTVFGVYDILRTGQEMRQNVSTIINAQESGETSVEIPCVYPSTKYSAIFNLKYIDTETPYIWPNENMATYYGIESVSAIP